METRYIVGIILFLTAVCAVTVFATDPDGANVTVGTPETKTPDTPGSIIAEGGNTTPANLAAQSKTKAWQGFWGNVSGNITLEDTSADVFYDWNLTNKTGEVLASRNNSIDFTTIAGIETCTVDEDLTGNGNDATSKTFTNASVNFEIAGTNITAACQTFPYVNSAPQSTDFEEIITSATGVTSIYVSKINASAIGFNGATVDYQIMVPENRTKNTVETYYIWVEFD